MVRMHWSDTQCHHLFNICSSRYCHLFNDLSEYGVQRGASRQDRFTMGWVLPEHTAQGHPGTREAWFKQAVCAKKAGLNRALLAKRNDSV
jgi:hypothetical protein